MKSEIPEIKKDGGPEHECDWYQKGTLTVQTLTLVVLAITMKAVFRYANDASRANDLTRRAIDVQSRPYIRIIVKPSQTVQRVERIMPGQQGAISTITLNFEVSNIGKLPAMGKLRRILEWSPTKLNSPPTLDGANETEEFTWPTLSTESWLPSTVLGDQNMTEGQHTDLRAGTGFIYFRAEMRYGESGQYTTAVCWQLSLTQVNKNAAAMPNIDSFALCPDDREHATFAN
jgi:hypothetical protein